MLYIIPHPFFTPAVLRESVDAPPRCDHQAVEKFLTATRASQPDLPDQEQNRNHDAVADERTAHDEMRQALADMIVSTETERRNPSKQHLYPAGNRHSFPHHPMHHNGIPPYLRMDPLLRMQL